MKQATVLIVGSSIAGLAIAACLRKKGIDYIIIEKESQVAAPWHNHYERLHLHTDKSLSALPFKKFGADIPRYPSRQQVVDYLEDYQKTFDIQPLLNTEAQLIRKEDQHWITETNQGDFQSRYLIMATGPYGRPKEIRFAGMDTFPGRIMHSYGYKSGRDFTGQSVLVVGFGNSACEIAIDLYEQGARPAMAVRSPVNIIPRDLLGIPIVRISLLLSKLPTKIADAITMPIMRLVFGDITKLGLKKKPYGAFEQVKKDGSIPLLDLGTVKHIREGHIHIYDDIDHIDGSTVYFTDGKKQSFDAIVAAIGYYRDVANFLRVDQARFDDLANPLPKQKYFGLGGLYFCGFWIGPTGEIREISKDAVLISNHIAGRK